MRHLWEGAAEPQGAEPEEECIMELCHIFSHIMQFNNGQHFRRIAAVAATHRIGTSIQNCRIIIMEMAELKIML